MKNIKRHGTELKWINFLQSPYSLGFNDNIYHFNASLRQWELGEIVSEYDQEIPQSQTADNPVAR